MENVERYFAPSNGTLRRALCLAREVVEAEWAAISSIADALLERDWISGDEAALLFEAAHGMHTPAQLAEALEAVRRLQG